MYLVHMSVFKSCLRLRAYCAYCKYLSVRTAVFKITSVFQVTSEFNDQCYITTVLKNAFKMFHIILKQNTNKVYFKFCSTFELLIIHAVPGAV